MPGWVTLTVAGLQVPNSTVPVHHRACNHHFRPDIASYAALRQAAAAVSGHAGR
jgi:hypothetical protein